MGAIKDSRNPDGLEDLARRVKILETASPLRSASVTAGQVRIGGTAILLVDSSGGIIIHGLLSGDGTLTWTGTTNLNGPVNIAGIQTVAGAINLTGTETISGNGGLVFPGSYPMTLSPTAGNGSPGIGFPQGYIAGNSLGIFMGYPGTLNGFVAQATQASMGAGNNFVAVDTAKTRVTGPFWLDPTLGTTTSSANVFMNSTTGLLQRSTSARRFKIGPKLMDLAPSLLDVRMKDWIDKTARANGEPDVRVPGVIAEEVHAAGGDSFVTRDAKGRIEGVAYDRLAMARTQVLSDKLDAALKRIEELEKKLAA